MTPSDSHLEIGSLLFEGLDQIDLTGPYEVFSRLPNATYRVYGKIEGQVRDLKGLRITPDAAIADAPQLDILHIPGGAGQEALMEDEAVLGWIRSQAAGAKIVFSVCTGALVLGAAGQLKGRRATTHWNSFHLLPFFGAIPVDARVVLDGDYVFAAGVTAGIDGALTLASLLRGEDVAQSIQLHMAYAPEPPFGSGDPKTAPAAILADARVAVAGITAKREATARRAAARLRVEVDHVSQVTIMTDLTFTKTAVPDWLLAMWKEIDDKTFGAGFDCFAENAVCNLGVADWHGRETIRRNLRDFIDKGFTARHDVVEFWDSPSLKIFHGKVAMTFDDPAIERVRPTMAHFFYMDEKDPTKVVRWVGAVGPTGF